MEEGNVPTWDCRGYGPVTRVSNCNPRLRPPPRLRRRVGGASRPRPRAGVVRGVGLGALGYGYGGYYDPYYGGSYGPNYYNDGYAYNDPGYDGYTSSVVSSGADPSYCAQRYQSYDPASGTYLGYDGLRHPCP